MKIRELFEYASGGSTGAGGVASVASGIGGPMMPIIRRMDPGQSFFAPAEFHKEPTKKLRKPRKKRHDHK